MYLMLTYQSKVWAHLLILYYSCFSALDFSHHNLRTCLYIYMYFFFLQCRSLIIALYSNYLMFLFVCSADL